MKPWWDTNHQKIFYNPIWMPDENSIALFACYVPEDADVRSVDQLLSFLKVRYAAIIEIDVEAGRNVYHYYEDYIDSKFPRTEEEVLAYLFDSDKFHSAVWRLKERIEANQMPDYIIGTNEIEANFINSYDFHGIVSFVNELY